MYSVFTDPTETGLATLPITGPPLPFGTGLVTLALLAMSLMRDQVPITYLQLAAKTRTLPDAEKVAVTLLEALVATFDASPQTELAMLLRVA